jgi:hypothetical protein
MTDWPAELLAYIDGIRASFNSREEADDYLKVGLMKKWGPLDRAVAAQAGEAQQLADMAWRLHSKAMRNADGNVQEWERQLNVALDELAALAQPSRDSTPPASPPEAQPAEQRKPE